MAEVFPRRFGKYVLLRSLARGGMGEIYVAATGEPGFQKFCVIKKVIAERLEKRRGHFMPPSLLASQLKALQAPTSREKPIVVDIEQPIAAQVDDVVAALAKRRSVAAS